MNRTNAIPPEMTLKYKTSTMAVDGHLILTKANGAIDLAFIQFNHPGQQIVDVIAAVRLNGIDELKYLRSAIDEHIEKEENKET